MSPLLEVQGLEVAFRQQDRTIPALDRISFEVCPGQTVALIGESGCGKSLTALALLGLTLPGAVITGGRVCFKGRNLLQLSAADLRVIRGRDIGFVFQEPSSALNPLWSVESLFRETFQAHLGLTRRECRNKTEALLQDLGIRDPGRCLRAYPHQLSGGMKQRVLIGLAVCCQPELLIADEPTSALDARVRLQIAELLKSLQRRRRLSLLLVTQDLSLARHLADEVVVLYAGQVVETGPVRDIFETPSHPYTRALLRCHDDLQGGGSGEAAVIPGRVPPLSQLPGGCRFHPRCCEAVDSCRRRQPELVPRRRAGEVRCLLRGLPSDGIDDKSAA